MYVTLGFRNSFKFRPILTLAGKKWVRSVIHGPWFVELYFYSFYENGSSVENCEKLEADESAISVINNPVFNEAGRVKVTPPPLMMFTTTSTTEAPYVHDLKHVLHLSLLFFEAQRSGKLPENFKIQWRKDSG